MTVTHGNLLEVTAAFLGAWSAQTLMTRQSYPSPGSQQCLPHPLTWLPPFALASAQHQVTRS